MIYKRTLDSASVCHHALFVTTSNEITARTITRDQITALRYEAHMAGDTAMVEICDRALKGRGGKTECARALQAARDAGLDSAYGDDQSHA